MPGERWTRRPLKSRQTTWAARMARLLIRARVRPNHISLGSIAAAGVAAWCCLSGWYPVAAIFILLRLLCNLMDGMVAIEGGLGSPAGEIYNDLPDRISDALILCAAGYSISTVAYGRELGWAAAFLAVMTAYVRVLGGACGLPQDFRGPMAKPQRMAVLVAACAVAPFYAGAIAVALALIIAGSSVTVAMRLWRIVRQLESR